MLIILICAKIKIKSLDQNNNKVSVVQLNKQAGSCHGCSWLGLVWKACGSSFVKTRPLQTGGKKEDCFRMTAHWRDKPETVSPTELLDGKHFSHICNSLSSYTLVTKNSFKTTPLGRRFTVIHLKVLFRINNNNLKKVFSYSPCFLKLFDL